MCPDEEPDGGVPTMDETFDALASGDRRVMLSYLHRNGATTVSTLGEHVAADRHDTVPAAVTPAQRREATVRLHHVHVPKLVRAGFVDSAAADDLVEPTTHLARVLARLPVDLASGSWSRPDGSTALD